MRFYHLRFRDYTVSYKTIEPRGGATFVYSWDDKTLYFSMAKCNVTDNYCKRIGRDIALARFNLGNKEEVSIADKKDIVPYLEKFYIKQEEAHFPDVKYWI